MKCLEVWVEWYIFAMEASLIMTTQDIIARVDRFLDSRNLADPSIRKRAIRKVVAYMNDTGSFIKGGQVVLPSDKRILANAYEQFKGSVLNSAEKSAINHMYEVAGYAKDNSTSSPRTTPVIVKTTHAPVLAIGNDVEQALIKGPFVAVNTLGENTVPTVSGLYCIKTAKRRTPAGQVWKDSRGRNHLHRQGECTA